MEKTNKQIKVLAIVPYHPDFCAGQRFRIENWAKELSGRGIVVEYLHFTDENLTDVLYQSGKHIKKAVLMLGAFVRQLKNTLTVEKPDIIYIYQEAALAGPAIIERIVRRWNIPIIYDMDEPLFIPYQSNSNGLFTKLKFFSKVNEIFKMSDTVFAVNKVIADYAEKFNDDVHIVPMTVDTERYKPRENKIKNNQPIVAWVGTRTNQPNIELAVPAMRKLRKDHEFIFRIVADEPMTFEGLDVEFIKWEFKKEVPLLQESDIGIVPVKESSWSPWKFFFKTIQFMSLGMPIVATATGSNVEIIEDGVNGFLVKTEQDWHDKIKLLIENGELRSKLGKEARKTVLERFDIKKQYDFLEIKFKQANKKSHFGTNKLK